MSGMRILIVSDTHRRDGNFRRVLEKTGPIDKMCIRDRDKRI